MTNVSVLAGGLLALASAICNGSFAAVQKAPAVRRAAPHPIVFNLFVTLGVVASSLATSPFLPLLTGGEPIKFNPLACLSGALFVCATLFSFLAIPELGLAMAQGIWGGSALLTAFFWGVLGPTPVGANPRSWPGSLGGLALLLAGVTGMVFHDKVARVVCKAGDAGDTSDANGNDGDDEYSGLMDADVEGGAALDTGAPARRKPRFLLGVVFAVSTGLFGGSVNVPSVMTQVIGAPLAGVETLPSFGVGTLVAGLLVPFIYFKVVDREALRETGGLHVRALTLPGLVSGTIWNLGNLASVYANDGLSFAVAQPMMQCALLVSGTLGIFVFKEIRGRARIAAFYSFAVLTLAGAGVLAKTGPSTK